MPDVVIPNYNGSALLRRYLPSVRDALGDSSRVIVVDDCSSDNSLEVLRSEFAWVEVIARNANAGFSVTVNEGLRATRTDLVVLLNNDVQVQPGFIEAISPVFDDPGVFAVSPRIITNSLGGIDDGAKTGIWHHGMLWVDNMQGVDEVRPVLYTSGGASVYRRQMLAELGWFDEAYSPFNWEDVDLGYRAWKRGWKSVFQPAASVLHEHSATLSKLKMSYSRTISTRNSLLFMWRNIDERQLLREHRRWLPLVLAKRLVVGDWPFLRGWAAAYARRAEAVAARTAGTTRRVLSDTEIFRTVGVRTRVSSKTPPDACAGEAL